LNFCAKFFEMRRIASSFSLTHSRNVSAAYTRRRHKSFSAFKVNPICIEIMLSQIVGFEMKLAAQTVSETV